MTLVARFRTLLFAGCALALGVSLDARGATKMEELTTFLLRDSSFKVRLQAALVMGRLGDREAVGPLIKALDDTNKTVRGTAAQSLGRLGAPEALGALKALIKREKDAFVRREAEKAIAALGPADGGKKAKIYLTFGSFSGGNRNASAPLLGVLRGALQRELSKLSAVTFTLDGGDEKSFGKSGRLGFLIDGNVTRLDDGDVGNAVEINCDVKVMVARWPSKSIILWTNAGAAVQGGSRDKDRENARRDCLEASAGQLGEDLAKFFQSQGG